MDWTGASRWAVGKLPLPGCASSPMDRGHQGWTSTLLFCPEPSAFTAVAVAVAVAVVAVAVTLFAHGTLQQSFTLHALLAVLLLLLLLHLPPGSAFSTLCRRSRPVNNSPRNQPPHIKRTPGSASRPPSTPTLTCPEKS